MDGIKDLIEAFNNRLKSRIVGSIILSFIAVNWKAIFFVVFEPTGAVEKFEFFDANTTRYTLYLLPVLIGVMVASIMPWLAYLGLMISMLPDKLYKEASNSSQHLDDLNKMDFQEKIEAHKAKRERALINAAKRDEEVLAISNPEIRERLERDIEGTRLRGSQQKADVLEVSAPVELPNAKPPFTLHEFQSNIQSMDIQIAEVIDEGAKIDTDLKLLSKQRAVLDKDYEAEIDRLNNDGNQADALNMRVERAQKLQALQGQFDHLLKTSSLLAHRLRNLNSMKNENVATFEKYYE